MTTVGMPELRYTPQPQPNGVLLAEELAELAERAQLLIGATGVIIALRKNNELVVRTSDGIAPEVGASIPFPSGVTGLCLTTKKPQTCGSADVEAQLETSFRALNVRSVLGVPIEQHGEVCGVLAVLSQMPAMFSRTHVAVLMTLADVIAGKLAQYREPSDAPRPTSSVSGQVVEIDVQSLLADAEPLPAAEPPKPAPTREAPVMASQPATTVRVEPVAATPVMRETPAPIAMPSRPRPAKPLSALRQEPAESPMPMDPDVLSPAEDPRQHGSVISPKPVLVATGHSTSKPVTSPVMHATPHRTQQSKRSYVPFVGGFAAVVVLGLAAAFYPRHNNAAAPVATASIATEQAHVAAAPPSPIAVSSPKSSVEPPATVATSEPAASATITPKNTETPPTAAQPKPPAEHTARQSAPILQLASSQPKVKSEEPVESPTLALVGASNKSLPDLPLVAAPAAALAVHKPVAAVLVPAARLRGMPPQFPTEARTMHRSGGVKLLISISADGRVTDARVLSGDVLFRPASIAAVREWVYSPARLDGRPVASTAEVSLRFNAEQ